MEINYKNVTHYYQSKTPFEKKALAHINICFEENKIHGIIGKSGSGKTTLLELLNGLQLPTEGEVFVDGISTAQYKKDKKLNELRKKVGIVFQFPEDQIFNSTVEKEIAFSLEQYHYKLDQYEKHIKDALVMVNLKESYLKRDPYTLSSGEMRKVAIASVLAYNPSVILFDEPSVGLDKKAQKNLIQIMKRLKTRYHKTILIVSHDMDFLLQCVDKLYALHDGKLVISGSKKEVLTNIDLLKENEIQVPKVILFQDMVKKKKGIKLPYREEINDLIKDIYRYVK